MSEPFTSRLLKKLFPGAFRGNEDSELLERYPDLPERMVRLQDELFAAARHQPSQATIGLFSLLVSHAIRLDGASFENETDLLERVRDRAWIGYRDLPLLIQTMKGEGTQGRPLRFLHRVADQKAQWLFLPIVIAIGRRYGEPIPHELHAERLLKTYCNRPAGMMLASFAQGEGKKADQLRGIMLTALLLVPKLPGPGILDVYLVFMRDELRTRYHTAPIMPQEALGRTERPIVALSAGLCADEISRVAGGALWVEALFAIEQFLYGVNQPQLDQFVEMRLIDRPQG